MAGRKDKNTVDYFPHYCITGKTILQCALNCYKQESRQLTIYDELGKNN